MPKPVSKVTSLMRKTFIYRGRHKAKGISGADEKAAVKVSGGKLTISCRYADEEK
jgi:hypothetical protein